MEEQLTVLAELLRRALAMADAIGDTLISAQIATVLDTIARRGA